MRALVTLLTDFGTADGYVAEMKGVILSLAPDAYIVDLTHDIPPQDIEAGRLALARCWRRFPAGTVHLAVVEPGVGSARAALAVESEGRFLVGPDNGVLSPALLLAGARAVELPVRPQASPTFHGRDVFAPAAAMLALRTPLDSLGRPAASPEVRRTPEPRRREDGALVGEVIGVDRFGNAVTNLIGVRGGSVEVRGLLVPVQRTYGDAPPGALTAVCGSSGLIELAVRNGSAASEHALTRGAVVVYRPGR